MYHIGSICTEQNGFEAQLATLHNQCAGLRWDERT